MNPHYHIKLSVKKYGGIPEDYEEIHEFMDSSKAATADVRHRCILHNSFGPFVAEKVFGHTIVNSDEKKVSVRQICEDHIIQDLGFIPTVEHWTRNMNLESWMSGGRKRNKPLKGIKL